MCIRDRTTTVACAQAGPRCPVLAAAASASVAVRSGCMAIPFLTVDGRSAGSGRAGLDGPRMETASLREDYLNQVQRDFLSRRHLAAASTPPAKGARLHRRRSALWPHGRCPWPGVVVRALRTASDHYPQGLVLHCGKNPGPRMPSIGSDLDLCENTICSPPLLR